MTCIAIRGGSYALICVLLLTVSLVSCSELPPPAVRYDDREYRVISWSAASIGANKLQLIGTATQLQAAVADDKVYAIEGVDPRTVIVMHAGDGLGVDYLFGTPKELVPLFDRLNETGVPAELLTLEPGLCRFLTELNDPCAGLPSAGP